jgi:hypothetical protein
MPRGKSKTPTKTRAKKSAAGKKGGRKGGTKGGRFSAATKRRRGRRASVSKAAALKSSRENKRSAE